MLSVALLTLVLGVPVARVEAKGLANRQLIPSDVATDPAGNVYVADQGNARIQKFSADGAFIRSWGGNGSGTGQFLFNLEGIAVDAAGNVYVTEVSGPNGQGADRIQKFSSSGAFLTKWGSRGSGNGQFSVPSGIATDPAGDVYVADSGNARIQKFDFDGSFISKWGSGGSGNGQFNLPNGIATDAVGNVYVVDSYGLAPASRNNRIQKFSSDGAFITKWGGTGSGNGQFYAPSDVATDPAGNVYVVDSGNNRIQKFSSDGGFITKWGGKGSGNGRFNFPGGIATDSAGNVYVADTGNNRIQKFTSDGRFITKWGHGPPSRSHHKRRRLVIPTSRRKAFFRPSCGLDRRCRALVTITGGGRTLARGRYSIPAHSSRRVAIALTGAGRRALSRKRRVRAKLTIVDTRTHKRETLPVVLKR
jgi:sugar lactone lactonase YvrE